MSQIPAMGQQQLRVLADQTDFGPDKNIWMTIFPLYIIIINWKLF